MMRKSDGLVNVAEQEMSDLLAPVKRERLIKLLVRLATLEVYFSPEQVAKALGISKDLVMRQIRRGKLRAHLVAHNRWRIPRSAFLAFNQNNLVSKGASARTPDV